MALLSFVNLFVTRRFEMFFLKPLKLELEIKFLVIA